MSKKQNLLLRPDNLMKHLLVRSLVFGSPWNVERPRHYSGSLLLRVWKWHLRRSPLVIFESPYWFYTLNYDTKRRKKLFNHRMYESIPETFIFDDSSHYIYVIRLGTLTKLLNTLENIIHWQKFTLLHTNKSWPGRLFATSTLRLMTFRSLYLKFTIKNT